jgi:hypothetical protein
MFMQRIDFGETRVQSYQTRFFQFYTHVFVRFSYKSVSNFLQFVKNEPYQILWIFVSLIYPILQVFFNLLAPNECVLPSYVW